MQDQPPVRTTQIDGFAFADTGKSLRGRWPVAHFPRLQDLVNSSEGDLEYEIAGTKDGFGRPALALSVSGELQLTCQRCLKPLSFPLGVESMLVLASSEEEIETQPVEPEGPDRVVGSREMPVGTLLEDEILLAIPFAPRHERCSGDPAVKGEVKASPFADLRGLLNRGGRTEN
jgi:uncharacterized protein